MLSSSPLNLLYHIVLAAVFSLPVTFLVSSILTHSSLNYGFKLGFLSIRATLGWTCERSRCCSLQAFSLSVWSSASLPLWSPPSPCTQSGSWWLLAPVTALACMITSRRTTSSSSKESTFRKQNPFLSPRRHPPTYTLVYGLKRLLSQV